MESKGSKHRGVAGKVVRVTSVAMAVLSLLYVANVFSYMGIHISIVSYCSYMLVLTLINTFLVFPATKKKKGQVTLWDIAFLIMGVCGAGYLAVFAEQLQEYLAGGTATMTEFVLCVGLVIAVLEGTRRTGGLAMAIVAALFFIHLLSGPYLPGFLNAPPVSLERIAVIFYLSPSGLFSMPLVVTFTIVVVFILFGAFLEKSGTGKFIIDAAYSLTGRFTGGPAKTSVVASAAMGTMTGATVVDLVTVGSITIPLMKRVGYTANFAGAVECVAGNGGQIMPPVMGLVAFFMAEILGVSYWAVCVAAVLPALLYYFVLYVQIHYEAVRLKLYGLPMEQLPELKGVLKQNWYYVLPALFLIFLLGVLDLPVQHCGLYVCLSVLAITLYDWVRGKTTEKRLKELGTWFVDCLASGARALITPAMATASAGIILGSIGSTGFGFRVSSLILNFAGSSLLLLLFITAATSFVLGMGMTSTPCYLILVALVAPSMIKFGVTPMAAHLFLFYWGIASFITPPVAVAAFVAAGISGGSPFRTGYTAMRLGVCNYLIPFMFVYFPSLLWTGPFYEILITFVRMLTLSFFVGVGLEGYFMKQLSWGERVIFLAGSGLMMVPGWQPGLGGLILIGIGFVWHYRASAALKALSKVST